MWQKALILRALSGRCANRRATRGRHTSPASSPNDDNDDEYGDGNLFWPMRQRRYKANPPFYTAAAGMSR